MKIAVFGDSYADSDSNKDAWWRRLQEHEHEVVSFGKGGSSILYSAKLLDQHHVDFDFNIWCMTTPGRFSIPLANDEFFHSTHYMDTGGRLNANINLKNNQELIEFCQGYLKYVFNWDDENLIGKCIAHYFLDKIPNLMIVPSFNVPLRTDFDLFSLCQMELEKVMPNMEISKIYRKFQDIRSCHLSRDNNKILADNILAKLTPGIFSMDYKKFNFDNLRLEEMLRPL